ncbi:MAG: hypothetical protein GF403_10285 [Candidatus Coatesbacteria bacterium]|nr:hypothetical protein [Candidatus Coatesbacteria bacterium]
MRIDLLYFSSTGNTRLLAEHAREWLGGRGIHAELHEAVTTEPAAIVGGLLIVLYPVWGSDMPGPLQDVLDRLKPTSGNAKIALIGNCGIFTGDTGIHRRRILRRRGWEVVYVDHVMMPVNINIPGFNLWPVPGPAERDGIIAAGRRKLERIMSGILAGERRFSGRGPLDRLGGWSQRAFYEPALQLWRESFAVDAGRCVRCGFCARLCPTGNITVDEAGVRFGGDCLVCTRCYNLCPEDAVLIGPASRDTGRYKRYKGPGDGRRPQLYR